MSVQNKLLTVNQEKEQTDQNYSQDLFSHQVLSDVDFNDLSDTEVLCYNNIESIQKYNHRSKLAQLKSVLLDRPVRKALSKFTHGSMKGSIFNLTTATIGAGVLSVPRSFYYSGVILSLLLYFLSAVLGYISNFLLVKTAEKIQRYTYMSLAHKTCNKYLVYFIKFNFLLANWGFVVAYVILVNKTFAQSVQIFLGDSAPFFLRDSNGKFWAPVIMLIIIFPLSLFRTLGALRFVALMSVIISFYITFIIFIEPLTMRFQPMQKKIDSLILFRIQGIFTTFSTSLFAFTCQNNTLDIYKELQNPIRRRIKKVIFRVMAICFSFYALAGVFGYLTFADNTDQLTNKKQGGIILLADYHNYTEVILSLVLIGVSITLALPFNIKPCKDCLLDIFYPGMKVDTNISHFILTAFICITSLLAGLYIPMMSDVITLMGAASSPLICFVFPTIFYLKTFPKTKTLQKTILISGFIIMMIIYSIFGIIDFFLKISDNLVNNQH